MGNIYHAQTDGTKYTVNQGGAGQWYPIPNLTFNLPASTLTDNSALIFLNVPMVFARGGNGPGANFGITIDGGQNPYGPTAAFTADSATPQQAGQRSITLVVRFPLDALAAGHVVEAVWQNANGSTVTLDGIASLSAITGFEV